MLGEKQTIVHAPWPVFDPELACEEEIELVLQVNGKLRDAVRVAAGITDEEARAKALASEKVQKWLGGKKPKKIIVVGGKLVNVVV